MVKEYAYKPKEKFYPCNGKIIKDETAQTIWSHYLLY